MDHHQAGSSLSHTIDIVQRRWGLVLLAVVVTTFVALVLSALQTPVYAATSAVLVEPRGQDSLFADRIVGLNERSIDTEIQVIEGEAVRSRVQSNLGLDELPPRADAAAIDGTDVIEILVEEQVASNSAILADEYATAYIEVRRERAVAELLSAGAEVQRAIDSLQVELDALVEGDPRRGPLIGQMSNFETTLEELRVDAALRTGGAAVIESAEVPDNPVAPTPWRTMVFALAFGLVIGLASAFVVDRSDDRFLSQVDIEMFSGHPVIATIPDIDGTEMSLPMAMVDPTSSMSEAYRGLRMRVQFLGLDQDIKVIQVTSAVPAEGKSTVAANLAVVLAQTGKRVALVDADLRRARLHTMFRVAKAPGLTEMLLGEQAKFTSSRVAVDVGSRSHVSVYPCGTVPANPGELLAGPSMRRILSMLAKYYDYVIVDSPPVLPVADALSLTAAVDAVIVVVRGGAVRRDGLRSMFDQLRRVGAPVSGLVLNRVKVGRVGAYQYGGYETVTTVGDEQHSAGDVAATG